MSSFHIFLSILLFLLSTFFLVSNIFGLPGNLLIFLLVLGYKLITGPAIMSWWSVIIIFLLFVAGEVLESFLGVRSARKAGVSKKAAIASFIGAVLGSILLAPFLFYLGAVLGAVLGAFLGAFIVTLVEERNIQKAVEGGAESAKGRIYGTLLKGTLGMLMILTAFFAVIK